MIDVDTRLAQTDSDTTFSGRLLLLAMIPLVAFMATAHLTVEGPTAGGMTAGQARDRAFAWVLVAILWVLPVVLAAFAFRRLASGGVAGRRVRILSAVGVALLVGHVVVQSAVLGMDQDQKLGGTTTYAASILLSLLGWWAVDVAAVVTCLWLARKGPARRTATVIGPLSALLTIFEVVVYLPALVGEATLHQTVGLPPMILPILWAILGGVLLRHRDPADQLSG